MGRLTEAQLGVMKWLGGPREGSRLWAGAMFGHPSKAAVNACVRKGLAAKTGHPGMDLYVITDAGRQALASSSAGD